MGRQKKDSICFNIRADAEVMRRFTEYCDRMGQTKTLAFERIMTAYLDQVDAEEKKKICYGIVHKKREGGNNE